MYDDTLPSFPKIKPETQEAKSGAPCSGWVGQAERCNSTLGVWTVDQSTRDGAAAVVWSQKDPHR